VTSNYDGNYEDIRRLLLSCSLCGTYHGAADLVVACEQADAAALADAWAALCALQPELWAERCGVCDGPLSREQLNDHRLSWSLDRTAEIPPPLCDRCLPDLDASEVTYARGATDQAAGDLIGEAEHLPGDMQAGRTAGEMRAALAALIAEVEGGASGGRS
jgi:hypothetical protein